MPLANKKTPRRTSDFQGLKRAQHGKTAKGELRASRTRPVDLRRSSSGQDVAAILRSLRKP
jgi:hypothetical protein